MEIAFAESVLYVFLSILLLWALGWIIYASIQLRANKQKILWFTHIAWSIVNIAIAVLGIITVVNATLDVDFVTSQRNIVAINIGLDIIYVLIAIGLLRSARKQLQQVGSAIRIQGTFLFVFDIIFAVALTATL